jgi:hypothetical protein
VTSPAPHDELDAPAADVDRLLAAASPQVAAIAVSLRAEVRQAVPDAREQVDPADGLIAYGRGRRLRDMLFAIVPHTAHVNLQLADGADLPNPDGIIEGTGKRVRHVKIRSVEAAGSAAVRAVIAAQAGFVKP